MVSTARMLYLQAIKRLMADMSAYLGPESAMPLKGLQNGQDLVVECTRTYLERLPLQQSLRVVVPTRMQAIISGIRTKPQPESTMPQAVRNTNGKSSEREWQWCNQKYLLKNCDYDHILNYM